MSETEQTSKPVRPWQWPGAWARDENFWKDVATRTVSGLVVVLVVYVYGLAAGYFASPKNVAAAIGNVGAIGLILWIFLFVWADVALPPERKRRHSKLYRRMRVGLIVCALLMGVGLTAYMILQAT